MRETVSGPAGTVLCLPWTVERTHEAYWDGMDLESDSLQNLWNNVMMHTCTLFLFMRRYKNARNPNGLAWTRRVKARRMLEGFESDYGLCSRKSVVTICRFESRVGGTQQKAF